MKRSAITALALLMSAPALAQPLPDDPPPIVQPPPTPQPPQTLDPYVVPPPTVPPPRSVAADPYADAGALPPDAPRPAPSPYATPYVNNPYVEDASGCVECAPPPAPYVPVSPVPTYRSYQPPRRDNRGVRLIVGGMVLFGTSWVSSAIDAAFGTTPLVLVPLAGPIVAAVDYQQNYVHTTGVQLETALLVFDAAAQTAGLIMAIAGGAIHARSKRAVNVSWAGTGVKGTF